MREWPENGRSGPQAAANATAGPSGTQPVPGPSAPPEGPCRVAYRQGDQQAVVSYRRRPQRPRPVLADSAMFPGMQTWQPEEIVHRIFRAKVNPYS